MSSHRVLVVDDEASIQQLLVDQLSALGVEVHVAADGEEALEDLDDVAPSLILIDCLLRTSMTGFDLAEAIRNHPRHSELPIVMMSGVLKNPKTSVEARDRFGALAFLAKPLDETRLEALVDEVIAKGPPPGPEAELESEAPTPRPASVGPPTPRSIHPRPESPIRTSEGATRDARPPRARPTSGGEPLSGAISAESVEDGLYVRRPFPHPTEGDLEDTPVAQLLAALHHDGGTGMLDLTTASVHRRVYMVKGRPTFMQSNAERENVGALLLRRGRLTEHDFQRCRHYMNERRRTLQQSLLELRLASEGELGTAYKLLAGELLPMAVGMSAGSYQWRDTDAFVGRVPEGRFEPMQVIFRGVAEHVHPPQVFGFFAGREDRPIYPASEWERHAEAHRRVFPGAAALLGRIDGSQTFRSLCRARDLDPEGSLLPLFALVTSGMAALPKQDEQRLEAAVFQAAAGGAAPEGGAETVDREAAQAVAELHADIMEKDFFGIFDVPETAAVAEIKKAYFSLAKTWHVDRFPGAALGQAQPLFDEDFARIHTAYETLIDPTLRAEYVAWLERRRRGLPTDPAEIHAAEQLYDQAVAMMRRQDYTGAREVLEVALEKNPDPVYRATLGYAVFCSAPDDDRSASAAVKHLKRALQTKSELPMAHQFLGTIAFRRNHLSEAHKWWSRCLQLDPENAEATRGLRALAQTGSSPPGPRSGGILDRIRGKK
ncbi:MAG: response regulator [Myxococcota bacterium]